MWRTCVLQVLREMELGASVSACEHAGDLELALRQAATRGQRLAVAGYSGVGFVGGARGGGCDDARERRAEREAAHPHEQIADKGHDHQGGRDAGGFPPETGSLLCRTAEHGACLEAERLHGISHAERPQ